MDTSSSRTRPPLEASEAPTTTTATTKYSSNNKMMSCCITRSKSNDININKSAHLNRGRKFTMLSILPHNVFVFVLLNVVVVNLCNLLLLAKFSEAQQQQQQSPQSILQQQQQQQQQNGLLNSNLQYQQHNNILHFTVSENAPPGTYLGNIRSADGQIPSLVLPSTTPEEDRIKALYVNLTNGDLTTNAVLDREYREQYGFLAMVSQPMAEIKVTVSVKDVNDNAPMFLMPSANETNFVIEMPEGQRGVRKLLPLAVDFDSPQFGIKEFRIVSGNTPSGTFQLVEHEAPARSSLQQNLDADPGASIQAAAGADNPQIMQQLAQQATVLIPSQPMIQSQSLTTQQLQQHQLQQLQQYQQLAGGGGGGGQSSQLSPQSKYFIDLEVNQLLDRENQSSYQLVVEAIDGGQPPLMGRLMVTVNVQDINDNDPVFTRKLYECQFKEDTAKGTLLLRVQAHDADLDANGQITYLIKRHSSTSQLTAGGSNSNASDNNNNNNSNDSRYLPGSSQKQPRQQQSSSTAGATSKLTPQQVRGLQGASELHELQAGEASQQNIPSSGSNYPSSKLKPGPANTYSSPQDQLFEIDPIKGEIYLVHQLDYETDQVHELLIEARDHGKPSRSAYAAVKVFVIDVNDDPAPVVIKSQEDKKQQQQQQQQSANSISDSARSSELLASASGRLGAASGDILEPNNANGQSSPLILLQLTTWFAQLNSSLLFVIVLFVLLSLLFPVCLVKIKSRQPESDYNDTAGLTLASNNSQSKQSPLQPLIPSSGQQPQLPPTPCHSHTVGFFSNWPQTPGSTLGYYGNITAQATQHMHATSGSTMDCSVAGAVATPTLAPTLAPAMSSQLLDRWLDSSGAYSQVAHAQDWYGSYNWDYLSDWVPEYQTIIPLLLHNDALFVKQLPTSDGQRVLKR